MPVIRRVYKQGNSYVVSLPLWALEQLGMVKGDQFTLELLGRTELRLRPRRIPKRAKPPDWYTKDA